MVHIVIGTRAQLLKMAPVMLELKKRQAKWRWIYTAQHRETINKLLKNFDLPQPNITVFNWSSEAKTMKKMWYWFYRVMLALAFKRKKLLTNYTGKNHIILTHGDTITTWWGAILGKLTRCQVMHVESGLRSFNIFEPFPEEINRLITFCLSDHYACPGNWAIQKVL